MTRVRLVTVILCLAAIAVLDAGASTELVPFGATWRYLDDGSSPGESWKSASFDDASWSSGPSELGYGDGDEATVVSYGTEATHKFITTYFRHLFVAPDPYPFWGAALEIVRDDGAVAYLNGTEILRDNMPAVPAPITKDTMASVAIGGADERMTNSCWVPAVALLPGTNCLAVEIHQALPDSSDISFNARLSAVSEPSVVRGPYLQMVTAHSVVVRWRTDAATDSRVIFGGDATNMPFAVYQPAMTNEHIVAITNLAPATRYHYAIGTSSNILSGGEGYTFATAPPVGSRVPTRIWAIGDSGSSDEYARAVRDSYLAIAGARPADVWLMLGDNAYEVGSDSQFQSGVFDMYPSILRNTVAWVAYGNHDSYTADGAPYFDAFTLPTGGEAGGLPSGTERYYAFEHGNIHFICLDSQGSGRITTDPMLRWLAADLAATTQKWIVAFWHHPPYTKGSHDSDSELELIEMRENALSILEAGGADLVLGGHSHVYERSRFVDGFYATPTTLGGGTVKSSGDGREDGSGGAYQKPDGTAHAGTVYAVMGSSSRIGDWVGGSSATTNPAPHPLMVASLRLYGSMLIDVDGNRLDGRFIDSGGTIRDHFTILKGTTIQADAPDGEAWEYGGNPATLRITRSGATNFPVTVSCSIGGSASNGVDYVLITNAHLLAAGVSSADVVVNPILDDLAEGDETVSLSLMGGDSYSVGPTNSADATIRDRGLDGWRATQFGPDSENPAVGTRIADPDRDGIPNLIEFALGLDPFAFDRPVGCVALGDDLMFRFQRNAGATDVTLVVEGSASLGPGNWVNLATLPPGGAWEAQAAGIGVLDSGAAPQLQVTVTLTNALLQGERYFLRIRCEP